MSKRYEKTLIIFITILHSIVKLLKKSTLFLKTPRIFKKSLEDSTWPSKWKEANVTAIFKSEERKLAENYRPISLTSVPCKLMEKLERNALVDHMTQNNLFSRAFDHTNGSDQTEKPLWT